MLRDDDDDDENSGESTEPICVCESWGGGGIGENCWHTWLSRKYGQSGGNWTGDDNCTG
jgi:hypothetical protein